MGQRSSKVILLATLACALVFGNNANGRTLAARPEPPELPRPSGRFGIGRAAFDWIDPNRRSDMTEDIGPHAELMVYLWYPTESLVTKVKGILFPGAKQIDSAQGVSVPLKAKMFGGNWTSVVSGSITSHAVENALIAKDPKAFPVILFSPGAFGTTFQYSSIIEDLVSHGYIVAAIEHTSEVFAVVFPDGRVHVYSETRIPKESIPPPGSTKEEYEAKLEAWYRHNVDVRAADISFVLDKLTELNRNSNGTSQFLRRLDLDHVAVVGHSRGGWAAVVACRRDPRIRACVNEDGNAGGQGLQYPGASIPKASILYVEVSPVLKPGTTTDDWIVLKQLHVTAEEWVRQWHEKVAKEFNTFPGGGYFVELRVPGLEHYSFSDEVHLRAAKDGSEQKEEAALRDLRLTEDICRVFLDGTLKNENRTTLKTDSEMTVHHFPRQDSLGPRPPE
jgi:pimeloyl-ACP methyl ester carboxylesterase